MIGLAVGAALGCATSIAHCTQGVAALVPHVAVVEVVELREYCAALLMNAPPLLQKIAVKFPELVVLGPPTEATVALPLAVVTVVVLPPLAPLLVLVLGKLAEPPPWLTPLKEIELKKLSAAVPVQVAANVLLPAAGATRPKIPVQIVREATPATVAEEMSVIETPFHVIACAVTGDAVR
jgi:hypothetical protein